MVRENCIGVGKARSNISGSRKSGASSSSDPDDGARNFSTRKDRIERREI
jgi:hypothetical protein